MNIQEGQGEFCSDAQLRKGPCGGSSQHTYIFDAATDLSLQAVQLVRQGAKAHRVQ